MLEERVLVTGGSGFIAGDCIAQALTDGWRVRTTVRDLSREAAIRATFGGPRPAEDRLEVVAADLNADAGWAEATSDCAYVLHIASPFPVTNPENDDELVRPARDGALRVLAAARDAKVRRVVMTSSTAAVAYGHGGRDEPFNETDWSDPKNRSDTSAYERSKTIAERQRGIGSPNRAADWNWSRSAREQSWGR